MEFTAVGREVDAFQESVSAADIAAMARRAFGVDVVSAVELGGGLYNNTYRVDVGGPRPVILRVAPKMERQARTEMGFMRNEYASLPFFAPVAALMPRTLFADWTHDIVDRDYLWQTMLGGTPGHQGLRAYPRPTWAGFYRQLGTIVKRIHSVPGERFGVVAGASLRTWSDAVLSSLDDTVADLDDVGLDAGDLRTVMTLVERDRAVLDEITEPRLLHGDLWVPNVMLDSAAPLPTITGIFDHDRASWGDPAADWSIYVVRQRAERKPFWETYGHLADTPNSNWRALVYRARHIGAVRLERYRLRKYDLITQTYDDLRDVLDRL